MSNDDKLTLGLFLYSFSMLILTAALQILNHGNIAIGVFVVCLYLLFYQPRWFVKLIKRTLRIKRND